MRIINAHVHDVVSLLQCVRSRCPCLHTAYMPTCNLAQAAQSPTCLFAMGVTILAGPATGRRACDGPTACKQARTCAWQHTRCACGVHPRRACCSGWLYAKLC